MPGRGGPGPRPAGAGAGLAWPGEAPSHVHSLPAGLCDDDTVMPPRVRIPIPGTCDHVTSRGRRHSADVMAAQGRGAGNQPASCAGRAIRPRRREVGRRDDGVLSVPRERPRPAVDAGGCPENGIVTSPGGTSYARNADDEISLWLFPLS